VLVEARVSSSKQMPTESFLNASLIISLPPSRL
jgi:hypothetical protein